MHYDALIDAHYEHMDEVLAAAEALHEVIVKLLPEGAQAIALMKLEECVMWTAHSLGRLQAESNAKVLGEAG